MEQHLFELIAGSYIWTTTLAAALWKRVEKIRSNHVKHLEDRVAALESTADKSAVAGTPVTRDSVPADQSEL